MTVQPRCRVSKLCTVNPSKKQCIKSNLSHFHSFLATKDSFWTLHTRFRHGASKIASVVYDICDSIYEVLQPIYMSPPSEEDWKQIEHRFSTRWNFLNCIGVLDGKHIMMRCPPNSHSLFYNYKGFFSIVLMALVDADSRFIYIDVGNYGSNGDSSIFKNSALGQAFAGQILNVPPPKRYPEGGALPHCIVADEAFPLRMDLMRPYPHGKKKDRLPFDKSIFNYWLSRARRIIENAFGILVQRFRVFDRQIQMDNHNVIKIVNATCVLPMYGQIGCCKHHGTLESRWSPYLQLQAMLHDLQNQGYHSTDAAQRVRRIYKDFFNSEVGAVPW